MITNQYAGLGVTFAPYDLTVTAPVIANDSSNPTSPVLSGTPIFYGAFYASFSVPVNHVSFDSGYWDAIGTGNVQVYDSSYALIATLLNPSIGIYTYDLNYADIKVVGFHPESQALLGAAIDNFTFEQRAVPEPASLLLLGSGLLGLLGYSRKRMKT